MHSIHQLLEQHIETIALVGSPNSRRAAAACALVDFMEKVEVNALLVDQIRARNQDAIDRIKKKRSRLVKYWIGRTNHLEPETIYVMISNAKLGKNPQALFNYLLTKHPLYVRRGK